MEEILIESSSPEGFAVAESGGYVVALNTELTPELISEGLARDLVRTVQDTRKDAGLQISDHITLNLQMPAELAAQLQPFLDTVKAETLADAIEFAPGGAYTAPAELGDAEVIVGVTKV
jgi:isoleucyl-tRNA synthetase